MISNKHLFEELKELEAVCKKTDNEYERALLKSNILIVKLLQNVRTNQVLSLEGSGIDLIKSNVKA